MKLKIPDIPVDYPKTVLLLTLLAIILATLGMKNLYFRGDYQIFFDDTNPQLQAFQEIEATFNKTDTISIVIAPENGSVFTPEYLTLIRDITEAAWQTPYSSRSIPLPTISIPPRKGTICWWKICYLTPIH
ncbi:predicted exporter of the RND superfamily [Photobacterium aphoticum]|uniref:Predicted exporter of the RND superfamily n=1 Tax=Photobacterium aphoticum TaxID=754436 RepID=A0A090QLZ7_9GAMM|nr:predicted exporter of the RND superfamily [Photobacterium aphoticum]